VSALHFEALHHCFPVLALAQRKSFLEILLNEFSNLQLFTSITFNDVAPGLTATVQGTLPDVTTAKVQPLLSHPARCFPGNVCLLIPHFCEPALMVGWRRCWI
jgi:hypothetical protein